MIFGKDAQGNSRAVQMKLGKILDQSKINPNPFPVFLPFLSDDGICTRTVGGHYL